MLSLGKRCKGCGEKHLDSLLIVTKENRKKLLAPYAGSPAQKLYAAMANCKTAFYLLCANCKRKDSIND